MMSAINEVYPSSASTIIVFIIVSDALLKVFD